jgi:hypothetical protein
MGFRKKKVATCWYEYPINLVKPWAGMLHRLTYGVYLVLFLKPGATSNFYIYHLRCDLNSYDNDLFSNLHMVKTIYMYAQIYEMAGF